jgi:hypothetical protein
MKSDLAKRCGPCQSEFIPTIATRNSRHRLHAVNTCERHGATFEHRDFSESANVAATQTVRLRFTYP